VEHRERGRLQHEPTNERKLFKPGDATHITVMLKVRGSRRHEKREKEGRFMIAKQQKLLEKKPKTRF
jgi:hypothetical protein